MHRDGKSMHLQPSISAEPVGFPWHTSHGTAAGMLRRREDFELELGISCTRGTFSPSSHASIRRFLTSTATDTLVSAFVLSRIDYCNSLLFGSVHDVTSHLQRVQSNAARVILCLPKSSSITIHLRSLHWLPVKVRSTYKIACLCYH